MNKPLTKKLLPYTDNGTALEGYASFQEGSTKNPLVVLCHAWAGRDPYIMEKADRLAQEGFTAFALDVYGKGVLGSSREENLALKKPFVQDRVSLQRRLLAGLSAAISLENIDPERIAVLGYGFGGMNAIDLARTGENLKGTISVYGHFDEHPTTSEEAIKGEVLALHGYRDPVEPVDKLYAFQERLNKAGVPWSSKIYGEAMHAFATPSAQSEKNGTLFNKEAAADAWQEVLRFLHRVLK